MSANTDHADQHTAVASELLNDRLLGTEKLLMVSPICLGTCCTVSLVPTCFTSSPMSLG